MYRHRVARAVLAATLIAAMLGAIPSVALAGRRPLTARTEAAMRARLYRGPQARALKAMPSSPFALRNAAAVPSESPSLPASPFEETFGRFGQAKLYVVDLQAGDRFSLALNGAPQSIAMGVILGPDASPLGEPDVSYASLGYPVGLYRLMLDPNFNPQSQLDFSWFPVRMRFVAKVTGTYLVEIVGTDKIDVTWSIEPSEADDDIPGVPAAASMTGSLTAGSDWADVYSKDLDVGQILEASMTASADSGQLGLMSVYAPGTKSIYSVGGLDSPGSDMSLGIWPLNGWAYSSIVSSPATATSQQRLTFSAETTGTHYLEALAVDGDLDYTIQTKVLDPTSFTYLRSWPKGVTGYGGSAAIKGRLLKPDGSPLSGVNVLADRAMPWPWSYGPPLGADELLSLPPEQAEWLDWRYTGVYAVTDEAGAFELRVPMQTSGWIQLRYNGVFFRLAPVLSDPIAVKMRARLTKPAAREVVHARDTFSVQGALRPLHNPSRDVLLYCQRYEGGKWTTRKVVRGFVTLRRSTHASNKYSAAVMLPFKGRWRIKAYHADFNHAPSWSEPTYVRVK